MKSFRLALGFLTILPASVTDVRPGDLGRAAMWFPLIGLAIGMLLAAANFVLRLIFQPLLTATLIVALWAALTGGLHLDGLADCCDGLLASTTPERRLEIMRDPRLGSFGVTGLTLFLVLKVLALSSAAPDTSPSTALLLLFAPSLARWLILVVGLQPSARHAGMGADFSVGLKPYVLLSAAVVPIALLFFGTPRFLLAAGLAHLVTWGIAVLSRARLGGVTGDVFGLTVELGELAVLLTFAAS